MDPATDPGMSTPEFTKALADIHEALAGQRDERHRTNSQLATTLLTLTNRQLSADESLVGMRADVASLVTSSRETADSIKRLTDRLLGNPAMQTTGVVQELQGIVQRLDKVERKVETVAGRLVGGFLTITGIASILAWTQSQFHWPFGGGGGQ